MKSTPVEAVSKCPRIVCNMAVSREPFSASLMAMQLICACFRLRAADGMYGKPLLVDSKYIDLGTG